MLTLAQGMTTGDIFNPVTVGIRPPFVHHVIKSAFIKFGKPHFSEKEKSKLRKGTEKDPEKSL